MTKRKNIKRLVLFFSVLVMLLTGYAGSVMQTQAASAKTTAVYKKRMKTAKKNLKKRVLKELRKGYAYPSCKVRNCKRKGKYMFCDVDGSIGEGAYMMSAKVNLKTGKVKIIDNMVSIPDSFKIKVK